MAHHFHDETGNFGITSFLWDRLFGTQLDEPVAGQDGMRVGVPGRDGEENLAVMRLLARPFERRCSRSETAARADADPRVQES